jgi:ubiquitin carboxyl-terminal hydrolase 47
MQSELEKYGIKGPLDHIRVRKKTWRNPGTILLDDQVFDEDISIYANWEMFIEVLNGPEPLKTMSDMSLFARRWHPSTYTLDPFQEVVLKQSSPIELKEKVSEISGIPVERVEFTKGRGSFPCEVSILEVQDELDWNQTVTVLSVSPLYICDDGAVIYYRDSEEKPMVLSEERRREIQKEESARYAKSNTRYQHYRKEKALKIYTDSTPQSVSPRDSPPAD